MTTLKFNQLEDICKNTGDSKVISYQFENSSFHFCLELENRENIYLKFKTNNIFADKISENKLDNIGFLQKTKLSELFIIKNKFYSLDDNFKNLMNIRKAKASMALGLLEKEADYLISYIGYRVIFSFLVNSNDNFDLTSDITCPCK